MKNFSRWADGCDPALAILSHLYANSAELVFALLKAIRIDSDLSQDIPQPPLAKWLKLYRQNRLVQEAFAGTINDPTGFLNFTSQSLEEIDCLPEVSSPEELRVGLNSMFDPLGEGDVLERYIASFTLPQEEFDKYNPEDAYMEKVKAPQAYFFIRVYIPCWLLYGTVPGVLLRKARQGHVESLEQLVRLDSSVIFESRISRRIHESRVADPKYFESAISSLGKPPKGKITLQKVKVFLAGQVAHLSSAFGKDLTEPEIRELFDAIAQDKGLSEIDTDLPESPHAFYVAIQRELPFWNEAYSSHKK